MYQLDVYIIYQVDTWVIVESGGVQMANENRMEYVILGLLSHEPLTGYEMKKRMDTTMNLFWSGSYGSIYPTLQKLSDNGYIQCEATNETGREKKTYSLLDAGRKRLHEWLSNPQAKNEIKYETLLKFFFGADLTKQEVLSQIQVFRAQILENMPHLQQAIESLETAPPERTHEFYRLTARYGVKIYEASLEWCEEVERYLNK